MNPTSSTSEEIVAKYPLEVIQAVIAIKDMVGSND